MGNITKTLALFNKQHQIEKDIEKLKEDFTLKQKEIGPDEEEQFSLIQQLPSQNMSILKLEAELKESKSNMERSMRERDQISAILNAPAKEEARTKYELARQAFLSSQTELAKVTEVRDKTEARIRELAQKIGGMTFDQYAFMEKMQKISKELAIINTSLTDKNVELGNTISEYKKEKLALSDVETQQALSLLQAQIQTAMATRASAIEEQKSFIRKNERLSELYKRREIARGNIDVIPAIDKLIQQTEASLPQARLLEAKVAQAQQVYDEAVRKVAIFSIGIKPATSDAEVLRLLEKAAPRAASVADDVSLEEDDAEMIAKREQVFSKGMAHLPASLAQQFVDIADNADAEDEGEGETRHP